MSLLDAIRRQLLGQAAMMQPGQGMGGDTQGLLGQGGQFGGGLLQSNLSQMNQGEGGLLGNIPQAALLGSAIYGQGIQGRDPFSALLPAVTQTAQLQKYLTPEKEKLMTAYDPKTGKTVFATRTEIEQKGLEPVPEVKESSLSKEALTLYKESETAPNFKDWFKELPDNKKQLWNKYIKGNEDIWMQMLMDGMPDMGGMPDTDTDQNILEIPENKNQLIDGQSYNVNGQILKWNKKEDKFK
jgi:hypothetical protein